MTSPNRSNCNSLPPIRSHRQSNMSGRLQCIIDRPGLQSLQRRSSFGFQLVSQFSKIRRWPTWSVMPSKMRFSSLRARVNITYMVNHQSLSSKPPVCRKSTGTPPSKVKPRCKQRAACHAKVEIASESFESSHFPRLSSN